MADDHLRLKALFEATVDLPDEAARRAALQRLGADPALGERVLQLVAREQAGRPTRLRAPVAAALAALAGAELRPGDRVGAWRLTGELGEGGMGRVFAAERDDGLYRQRAALKVLRGRPDPALQGMLARERQILASLEHPHIARLLDGGTTPGGQPYLVMAYVDGEAIDHWCTARRADAATRIRLIGQVADALDHAHRQLVVHCDLKPANVLVSADGHAVLLDFGIARLQQVGDADAPPALTPGWASPEQEAGGPVGSASDVYSLGRLADALMAGQPRADEWSAVVARACAADPAQRYATATALADDLRRWLQHRPLQALAHRRGHRLRKALRRRWPWFAAGALAAGGAAAFTLGLVHERDRARQAEREAQAQAATARAASRFLGDLFADADPRQARRPDLPAQALLDRGRERLQRELADQPGLQADLGLVLGQAYDSLGRPAEAVALLQQSAALAARLQRPAQEAQALGALAVLLANQDRLAPAEAAARRALELRLALFPADGLEVAEARSHLGLVRVGQRRWDEAAALLGEVLAVRRARLGDDALDTASAWHNLGHLAQLAGRPEQALPHYRQALSIKQRRLGEDHLSTLSSLHDLVVSLGELRRTAEALPLAERLVALTRRVHGPASQQHAEALAVWGIHLHDAGRPQAGREALAGAVAGLRAGGESMRLAQAHNNLALLLWDLGLAAEAEAQWAESLRLRQRLGASPIALARAEHHLGLARWRRGEGSGRALLAQAAERRRAHLPAEHPDQVETLLAQAELAHRPPVGPPPARPDQALRWLRLQARLGPPAEAEARLRQALEAGQGLPPAHPQRLAAGLDLAAALAAAGRSEAARAQLQGLLPLLDGYGPQAPLARQAAGLRRRLDGA